jgi:hypothetical protein
VAPSQLALTIYNSNTAESGNRKTFLFINPRFMGERPKMISYLEGMEISLEYEIHTYQKGNNEAENDISVRESALTRNVVVKNMRGETYFIADTVKDISPVS